MDVVGFTLSAPFSRALPAKLMDNTRFRAIPFQPSLLSGFAASGRVPAELRGLDMRIARDGTWYYRGSPINRLPLVKLFASVLRRENDGSYWLVTPAERGRVASRTRRSSPSPSTVEAREAANA